MSVTIENLERWPYDATAPRRMETPALVRRQRESLKDLLSGVLSEFDAPAQDRGQAALERFPSIYDSRPVTENAGGSGFNDSLWLYLMASVLSPEVIIESGVHKGHSTWLFREACPQAALYCFDVTFKNRVHRDENAQYFEHDWMSAELPDSLDKNSTLIFFDDHISHAQRLIEARRRGFRRLLFDDNFAAEHLYATGGAPVPTLAMLMDETLNADPESEIVWLRNGKRYRYRYCPEAHDEARAAIARYRPLPELGGVTRYAAGSGLSLVELVP